MCEVNIIIGFSIRFKVVIHKKANVVNLLPLNQLIKKNC